MVMLECANLCRHSHPEDFNAICCAMKVTIKGQLPFEPNEMQRLLEYLAESDPIDPKVMPVDEIVTQAERALAGETAPADWRPLLDTIQQTIDRSIEQKPKSIETLLARIKRLCDDSVLVRLKADEGWADVMRQDLASMPESDRRKWETLLSHASTVVPEPPATDWDVRHEEIQANIADREAYQAERDQKFFSRNASSAWRATIDQQIAAIGTDSFETLRLRWLQSVPNSKPGTLSQFSVNREILRGLLWTCEHSNRPELARAIRIAAEYFYRKNSPLGRTAVRILAHLPVTNGLEELTYLVQQVKAEIQVQLIQSARALVAARTGIPSGDLSDLPLPVSGFSELGRRVESLSGLTAELIVTGTGDVELHWFKANGEQQKSIPAKIKQNHEADLRNLKAAVKEVKSTLATGRERLESAPIQRRSWAIEDWRKRYFDHPVVATLGRRVMWQFTQDGESTSGIFDGRSLVNIHRQPLQLADTARVSVWHPLGSPVDEVLQWRELLAELKVTQPFKQAYREVYLLTDAERATNSYSNRFAAHILKQSQFRVLAKIRGWKTDYLGAWNGGDDGIAKRELPEWELRAELWTNGVGDQYAEAGGLLYVGTDQVRFCRARSDEPLPLSEVPPIVFSEIMRDVDLFVGVTSVGNDPRWQDGGLNHRFADYWQGYSFGELSETAVTRRAVLQRIIPRLKIADRCTFSDRFLIVRGDRRTYKIHLGSGNILMEPNDQYLCIVPAQGKPQGGGLFLPFEGDDRLSVILSKALLLADDTSITDSTILSQIAFGK